MKESDIFYRYRGRSQRIKYNELRSILDISRRKEQQLWMEQILRIAKVGISNIGVFDLTNGSVTGENGSFLIDETLLKKISFIREGEFSEREGKPTLKLIGNVEPINAITVIGKKQIVKETTIITPSDIVHCFLKRQHVNDPENYIKQICVGTTAYLPVYFYIKQGDLEIEKVVMMIDSMEVHSQAKEILKRRLVQHTKQWLRVSAYDSIIAIAKRKYQQEIRDKTIDLEKIGGQQLIYCVQSVRGFSLEELKSSSDIIFEFLLKCFDLHYEDSVPWVADNIRRAICWVDEALFMGEQQ